MKQRTNISVEADLLAEARALDLNVSALAEAALRDAVRQARAAAWAREHAHTLDAHRAWIEGNGLPMADWRLWTPG